MEELPAIAANGLGDVGGFDFDASDRASDAPAPQTKPHP